MDVTLLQGFSALDHIALAFFVAAWLAYHVFVESHRFGDRTLNALMNERRGRWLEESLRRDVRIIDTQILNGLQTGTGFFASTSLIAIGGTLAMVNSTDQILRVIGDLPLGVQVTRGVWEMKVIGLAIIFAYAFFKFAWCYRIFNYVAILIGALPPSSEAETPAARRAAREAANMTVVAGMHFNRGQRAFFLAIAYLGWFLGPVIFFVSTAFVLCVMAYRQFASPAYRAVAGG